IDGMGHQMPGATLLEKGLVALDKGKPAEHVPVVITKRPTTRLTSRPAMTYSDVKRPLPAHHPNEQAARVLASAKSYLNNGRLEGAEIGARRVLADYAQTPAAADAQVLLDRLTYIKPVALPYADVRTPLRQALFFGRSSINHNGFDAARLYFQRVNTLKADSPEAKEAKAWLAWIDAHPEQARPRPTSAAVLGTILFQSGLSYSEAGLREAAREAYRRVLHDYPNTPAAIEAKKLLVKDSAPSAT